MSGDQQSFQKAMSLGHSAAWEQNWKQAAVHYRQALHEFPDHPNGLNNIGLALFELKEYDQALSAYKRAAQVSPGDPIPLEKISQILELQNKFAEAAQSMIEVAEIYAKARDIDKAIENWQRAIHMQPENLAARTRLAIVFERTGRKTEAVSEYLAVASLMQRSGDNKKASQVVDYCLKIQPESPEVLKAKTTIQNNQQLLLKTYTGKLPQIKTISSINQSVQSESSEMMGEDPITESHKKAQAELAAFLLDENNGDKAVGKLPRRGLSILTKIQTGALGAAKNKSQATMFLRAAFDAQSQGEDESTFKNLEKAFDCGLDHPAAQYELGRYNWKGNPKKAIRYLQASSKNPRYALASYLLLGQIFEKSGDVNKSVSSYLNALRVADIQTSPADQEDELFQLYEPIIDGTLKDPPDGSYLRGICQNISSQLLRRDWRLHLQNARQLSSATEAGMVIPLAELLLKTGSNQLVESMANVRRLASQNMDRSAMDEAFRGLEENPTYLPLHIQIADLLLREGRTQEAISKYLLVVKLYKLLGESTQAIYLLTRIIKSIPMDINLRKEIIDLLIDQGRSQEAVQQYINLANMYIQLADFDDARQTYSAALRLVQQSHGEHSLSIHILTRIADMDLQRLDWRQAIRIFEQIRTLDPEDIKARSQIVELNFRLGEERAALTEVDGFINQMEISGKRQKVEEFLQGLITERPEKLELRKRLADLYVRNNQIAQAVEQLDVLADAILASGNRPGAIAMLQAIIALNPPNVMEYRNALAQIQQTK